MKILVIEPDEYYHHQFRDGFGPADDLRFSRSSDEALQIMRNEVFDLIVMELIFQDGHAYDFLPKIRGTPVVIYTNIGHVEDVQESLNLGVSAYFIKGQNSVKDIKKLILTSELLTTNY